MCMFFKELVACVHAAKDGGWIVKVWQKSQTFANENYICFFLCVVLVQTEGKGHTWEQPNATP